MTIPGPNGGFLLESGKIIQGLIVVLLGAGVLGMVSLSNNVARLEERVAGLQDSLKSYGPLQSRVYALESRVSAAETHVERDEYWKQRVITRLDARGIKTSGLDFDERK